VSSVTVTVAGFCCK